MSALVFADRPEREVGLVVIVAYQGAVCTENLSSGVVVMKSAQDGK
jgi:hypothetical protein